MWVLAYTTDNLAHVIYPVGVKQQDWVHELPFLAKEWWTSHGLAIRRRPPESKTGWHCTYEHASSIPTKIYPQVVRDTVSLLGPWRQIIPRRASQ